MKYRFTKKNFLLPKIPSKLRDLEEARKLLLDFNKALNDMIIALQEDDPYLATEYYDTWSD